MNLSIRSHAVSSLTSLAGPEGSSHLTRADNGQRRDNNDVPRRSRLASIFSCLQRATPIGLARRSARSPITHGQGRLEGMTLHHAVDTIAPALSDLSVHAFDSAAHEGEGDGYGAFQRQLSEGDEGSTHERPVHEAASTPYALGQQSRLSFNSLVSYGSFLENEGYAPSQTGQSEPSTEAKDVDKICDQLRTAIQKRPEQGAVLTLHCPFNISTSIELIEENKTPVYLKSGEKIYQLNALEDLVKYAVTKDRLPLENPGYDSKSGEPLIDWLEKNLFLPPAEVHE